MPCLRPQTCNHTVVTFIGHHFRDRAAVIATGRKVKGNIQNGCEKLDVYQCRCCKKTFFRKNKDKQ